MLWGVPYALLLLAGALPLIVFLHSLKPKGPKLSTSTLFIWERLLKEQPLGTRLGWLLKKNLLLILQLLAAAALIAALADPALLHLAPTSGDMVVVLDLSASMKAKGKSGTRFDAARKEFAALVDSLSSGRKMMVIGAGAEPRLIVPFTSDTRRLRDIAKSINATDAPGRVKDAILFAHAFLKRGSPDQVVVISDGAFTGAEEFTRPAVHLRLIKVDAGKPQPANVGIVGFEVRRHPEQAAAEIMVHLRNYTTQTVRGPLALKLGDKEILRETVEIGAEQRRVLIYPANGSLSGNLTGSLVARLEIDDDFPTDNQAYLALNDRAPLRLLYVGPGNPLLSNLLRFFSHVQVTTTQSWEAAPENSHYDVMIFDRVPVPPSVQGNVILIDTVPAQGPIRANGKIANPGAPVLAAKHPVAESLSLGDLHVQEMSRLTVGGEATVIARAGGNPLLVALDQGKLRALILGFDLAASDLPLRIAFPVLFHNALEWFQPQRREFPAESTQAGAPFVLRLPAGDSDVELLTPAGKKERLKIAASPFVFADTFEAGFYEYKSSGRTGRLAVNLLDENESQIAAPPQLHPQPGASHAQSTAQNETGWPLWPSLLVATIVLLFIEWILAWRTRLPLYPALLRAGALAALLIAWINPKLFSSVDALDVILSVDLSRSVGQEAREKALAVLESVNREKNPHTRTGLLGFGRAPEWEFLPKQTPPASDFGAPLDREETDLQAALQAAVAQVGEGRQGRILLISDGNENRGAALRAAPLLRAQGTQIWTLPASLARGRNEVYLSDFTLPQQVDSAEGFAVEGKIESGRAAPARVRLLRDGKLVHEKEIELKPGNNTVSFRESLTQRGNHSYELTVESADDTLAENNLLQGVVEVKGPPRVLLVSSEKESQGVLARVLRVQGYAVVESTPATARLTLAELAAFDLLVLDNVPAFQLTHAKLENVEKYVRDLGGGLLVVGGSQSYGAGGYYRTPLERILPVDMRPPARLDLPHVALLFVLDKSGSMGAGPEGGTKLDLAKAAALAAADIMSPTDQVGILAFDAKWDWALPFRQVGKGEWITEKLAGVQSDGGTDMYKAMVEAARVMATKQAAIKHVIALSDGLTDKADFNALIAKMARDGVTVSTVSVGNDADVALMAEIAKLGKGRGYVALDPQTVPQIFTTETLLISRDLLIEKSVAPTVVAGDGPLKGIAPNSIPPLRGYVLTYPKNRAELLMKADKDPLLASWRYGLGRVTAFTSDLSGRWGKEWVSWPALPQWASQLSRDAMRKLLDTRMRTEFHPDGEAVKVVTDLVTKDGKFLNQLNLKASIASPNRATQEQRLQQSAPGRYEGKFTPAQRGVHFLTLYAEGQAGAAPLQVATVPYIAPYPREYRELKPNLSLLSRLAEETGGELLDAEKYEAGLQRLYTPTPGKGTQGQATWWPLAALGLGLFLVDLILRSLPARPMRA
ncbi:MAG: VWA domain-containing protein [Deltaproteobacteria bacterium]|nr:VWA domain-containing protein [Deltaproteobacteria bacterium]